MVIQTTMVYRQIINVVGGLPFFYSAEP